MTDADGDSDRAAVDVSQGVFQIEDDGPDAPVNGQAALDTSCSTRPGLRAPIRPARLRRPATPRQRRTSPTTSSLRSTYGADGPRQRRYTLLLSANGIASGLFALDADRYLRRRRRRHWPGCAIMLNQVGNTITGSAGGTDYFTISIDSGDGRCDVHAAQPDLASELRAPATTRRRRSPRRWPSNIQVVADRHRRRDGDIDSASINVGQGVFSIQDDGPDASLSTQASARHARARREPSGRHRHRGRRCADRRRLGHGQLRGQFQRSVHRLRRRWPRQRPLCAAPVGHGIGSGLFALDPTDTQWPATAMASAGHRDHAQPERQHGDWLGQRYQLLHYHASIR